MTDLIPLKYAKVANTKRIAPGKVPVESDPKRSDPIRSDPIRRNTTNGTEKSQSRMMYTAVAKWFRMVRWRRQFGINVGFTSTSVPIVSGALRTRCHARYQTDDKFYYTVRRSNRINCNCGSVLYGSPSTQRSKQKSAAETKPFPSRSRAVVLVPLEVPDAPFRSLFLGEHVASAEGRELILVCVVEQQVATGAPPRRHQQ